MKDDGKPLPPTCRPLLPQSGVSPEGEVAQKDEGVKMRKELGLLEGTAIILGIIMGSGKITKYYYNYILFTLIINNYRNFHFTKGCFERCWFSGFFTDCLGSLRFALFDRCNVLC